MFGHVFTVCRITSVELKVCKLSAGWLLFGPDNIRRLEKLKLTDSRRYLYEGELPETDVVADHQLEVSEVVRDGAVEEDIEGDGSPLVLNALNQVGQVHSVANLQNGEIDQSQCA